MPEKIVWTERASTDLLTIVSYIKEREPEAAVRIGRACYDKAQILLQFPEIGARIRYLKDGDWRGLRFRRWEIVYALHDDVIIIARVWPDAMGDVDLGLPLPLD